MYVKTASDSVNFFLTVSSPSTEKNELILPKPFNFPTPGFELSPGGLRSSLGSPTNPPSNRVTFATQVTDVLLEEVPLASQMTEAEKASIWWSQDDLKVFHDAAHGLYRSMQYRPKTRRSENSYPEVLQRIYQNCSTILTVRNEMAIKSDKDNLVAWTKNGRCKRGIEMMIPYLRDDSKARREELVTTVLDMYRSETLDMEGKEEKIRRISIEITRPSCLFARTLAVADEKAIRMCGNQENVDRTS